MNLTINWLVDGPAQNKLVATIKDKSTKKLLHHQCGEFLHMISIIICTEIMYMEKTSDPPSRKQISSIWYPLSFVLTCTWRRRHRACLVRKKNASIWYPVSFVLKCTWRRRHETQWTHIYQMHSKQTRRKKRERPRHGAELIPWLSSPVASGISLVLSIMSYMLSDVGSKASCVTAVLSSSSPSPCSSATSAPSTPSSGYASSLPRGASSHWRGGTGCDFGPTSTGEAFANLRTKKLGRR